MTFKDAHRIHMASYLISSSKIMACEKLKKFGSFENKNLPTELRVQMLPWILFLELTQVLTPILT
jgi:hypothetical protein